MCITVPRNGRKQERTGEDEESSSAATARLALTMDLARAPPDAQWPAAHARGCRHARAPPPPALCQCWIRHSPYRAPPNPVRGGSICLLSCHGTAVRGLWLPPLYSSSRADASCGLQFLLTVRERWVWHSAGLDHWGRQLVAGGQEESRKPLCCGSASHDGEKRRHRRGVVVWWWWSIGRG